MSYDANDGWAVDGPISGTVQAKNGGDVPILENDGKLPGGMIPDVAIQFTVPTTAWTGEGPYSASVSVPGVEGIATPIIGPDAPDAEAREVLADAMISVVSVSSAGAVQLVADGDKPTVPLNLVATGTKGTQTGCFIGAFGTGGGGTNFYLNVHVTASAGSPDLSGITVSAVPTSGTTVTGSTNAEGECTLSVKQGMSYTIALSKTNFTFTPPSATVTIQDTSTDLDFSCYEAPKLTVVCTGTDKAGRDVTCTSTDGETITAVTGQDGRVLIILEIRDYTIEVDYPTGQGVSPESAQVSAAAGGVYTKNFTILDEPKLVVTVDDKSSAGQQNGRTITATPTSGGSAVTGQTSGGTVTLTLQAGVSYVISCDAPSGYVQPSNYPLTPLAGQTYNHTFDLYEEAKITVVVGPDAIKQGRTITATSPGLTTVSGQTDSTGNLVLSVPAGTWTIACDTPAGYFSPANQVQQTVAGQTYTKTFTLDKKPVLTVSVTPAAAASGLLVRVIGDSTVSAYTNAQGIATLELVEDDYTVSVAPPAGYLAPSTQALTAVKNNDYSKTFNLLAKPQVIVTVVDESSSGQNVGRTITATNGSDTVTGTTGSGGTVTLTMNDVGAYTISTDLPEGAEAESVEVTVAGGGSYQATITLTFGWIHTLTFNASTFQSDPTAAFGYADDAAGFTKVSNSSSSLAKVTQEGSWGFDPDTGMDCEGLFYCTFQNGSNGQFPHQLLDPYNLAQYIALWDDDAKEWDYAETGASAITSENTMINIPTIYTSAPSGNMRLSSKSDGGSAKAHTIDSHIYQYLALSVYKPVNSGGVLKSLSGQTATTSQTRATFRTQAQANTIRNGHAMLWNWWMYRLDCKLKYMRAGSTDLQRRIGQGGHSYSTRHTGDTNALGPFAGNVSGISDHVRDLDEDPWGCIYFFVDDAYCDGNNVYAGQSSNPSDNTSGKVAQAVFGYTSGFPNQIQTDDDKWGMGMNGSGSNSTGLCDYQNLTSTTSPVPNVCGGSGRVSNGRAGPAFLDRGDLSFSSSAYGARLAFVYDL